MVKSMASDFWKREMDDKAVSEFFAKMEEMSEEKRNRDTVESFRLFVGYLGDLIADMSEIRQAAFAFLQLVEEQKAKKDER
jgi:hypothetical protein